MRLENVYIPAGGDIPDRDQNPKFGQKLDFIERMTRWSEKLAEPTLIVGDFNVAPLECDVWSHKALVDVVSHTPIEIERSSGCAARTTGSTSAAASSPRRTATSPGGATARRTTPPTTAAGGSTICGPARPRREQPPATACSNRAAAGSGPSDHVPLILEFDL
jgi:exonuclease III